MSEQLLVTVGLSATAFKNEMKNINSDLKTAEKNFKLTEKVAQGMEDQFEATGKKIEALTKVFEAQEAKIKSYENRIEEVKSTMGELESANKDIQSSIKTLSSDYDEVIKTFGEGSKEAQALQSEISNLEKELLKNDAAISKSKTSLNSLNNELGSLNLEAELTKQSIGELNSELSGMKQSNADKIGDDFKDLASDVKKAESAIKGADFDSAAGELKNIGDSAEEAGDDVLEFSEKVTNIGSGLMDAGEAASDFGSKLTAPLVGAISKTDEYTRAMNGLQSQLLLSDEQMTEFSEAVKGAYGNNFGESWEEVANVTARVNQQLGLTGEELQRATEKSFLLSDTFEIDMQDSLKSVDHLMNNFGLSADEAFEMLVQGAGQGLNATDEMTDTIAEYSRYYKAMGFDVEDMFNQLWGSVEDGAFTIDHTGDAMKEFFLKITEGSDGTRQSLEKLGLNSSQILTDLQSGGPAAAAAFQQVAEKLGTIENDTELTAIAVELFGTKAEDLGPQVLRGLGVATDQFNSTLDAAEKINEIKYDSFTEAMDGLGRTIEIGLIQPIGESLLPILNDMMPVIQGVIDKITAWVEANPGLTTGIVVVVGAIGGLLMVIGPMLAMIGMASIGFISLSGILGGVAPIIAGVVAAVGLLAGGIAANFDGIKAACETLQSSFNTQLWSMQQAFGEVWTMCQDIYNTVIQPLFAAIGEIVEIVVDFIAQCMPGISLAFSTVTSVLTTVYNTIFKPLWDGIMEVVRIVIDWVRSNMPVIAQTFNSVMDSLKRLWDSIGKPVFELLKSVISNTIKRVTPILETLMTVFGAVMKAVMGFWNTIGKPVFDAVVEVAGFLVSKAVPFVQSFQKGVTDAMNLVLKPINWVIEKFEALLGWAGKAKDAVSGFIDKINPFKSVEAPDLEGQVSYSTNGLDVASFAHPIYNPVSQLSSGISESVSGMNDYSNMLMKELISATKQLANGPAAADQGGAVVIQIDNFNNNRDMDIQSIAQELEFYRKNSGMRGLK